MQLHPITEKFSSLLKEEIEKTKEPLLRLIVAFSGGVDSHVLLIQAAKFARKHSGIEIIAVYVNHGLSKNADLWQTHCQKVATDLNIPFFAEKVDIQRQPRQSLEKLARDARYEALAKYVTQNSILLTGQHADDQIETFLLALKRGSGPKGLSSMAVTKPFGRGLHIRPLITSTREEIEDFAQQNKLQWIEDESNQDTAFDRNYLRAEIVPKLSQRWPHIHQSVQRSAEHCAEQEALLDELLQDKLALALNDNYSISIEQLKEQSHSVRNRLLRMWFAKQNSSMPSSAQLDEIWKSVALARQDASPIVEVTQGSVRRFGEDLYFVEPIQNIEKFECSITLGNTVQLPDFLGELVLIEKTSELEISGGEVVQELSIPENHFPITVQFSTAGLSAQPSQRSRSRKMKKLWQEFHIPTWERGRFPVLLNQHQVIAVADLFVDINFVGSDYQLIWKK